jgi:hypothetical protein
MRLVLALTCSGCIAMSARAHVDAVSDIEHHGVQAGVDLGFGYAFKHSAIVATGGITTGTPTLGVHDAVDYVVLDDTLGYRVGFGGVFNAVGEPALVGLRLGSLFVLRSHENHESPEKCCFSSTSRTVYAASVEVTAGATERGEMRDDVRVGGSAGIGFEIYSLQRMW